MNMLNAHYLFASLVWGSVGVGYCIYGRRQQTISPFIGGIAMIAVSFLVSSAMLMSVICLALAAGVYWTARQGY